MCNLMDQIDLKLNKLEETNNKFSSFDDDLVRIPAVLEAEDVRENLREEILDYKTERDDIIKKKEDSLKNLYERLNADLEVSIRCLEYVKKQNEERKCN